MSRRTTSGSLPIPHCVIASCSIIALKPKDNVVQDEGELREAADRIARSGYPVRDEPDFALMAQRRAEYMSCVDALAEHLGKPSAVLVRRETA